MNILSHVEPVVMILTLPWPGETVWVPVTIKDGYLGKVCKFEFDFTLETENPADFGGFVGLENADYMPT